MNFSLARTSLIAEADLVGIAGERAVCDPRGVLYFPELRLLAVSDLHLEKGSSLAQARHADPALRHRRDLAAAAGGHRGLPAIGSSSAWAIASMMAAAPSACMQASASGWKR